MAHSLTQYRKGGRKTYEVCLNTPVYANQAYPIMWLLDIKDD